MNAVLHTARKELREAWRQQSAGAAAVGCAVLIAMALVSAVPRFRAVEAWKADAASTVREQWVTQGVRHPHAAAHFGIIAFRPLDSTALIEPGVSSVVGQMLPLETHARAFPTYAPAEDASSAVRFNALSPALLALTVIPLCVVLAGYGMLSGEREDGNLSMLLASGAAPRSLLLGKAAALAIVAGALLAMTTTLELAAIVWSGTPLVMTRFAGVQLVHGVYVLVWVAITIGISARTRSTRVALALCLTLWLANSLLLPRVAASIGRLVVREPSTEEFRAAIQRDIAYNPDGSPWVSAWSKTLIAETLEKYGVARIEDLPVGYAGIMLKGSDAHYEEVFEKHFARLHDLHRRQERWHHALSIAGPMVAARSLGQAFAGTDLTHARHFADAAERYRRMFVEATNDAIEKRNTGTGWNLRLDRDYWESIPPFEYRLPSPLWAVGQHALSAAVLAAWLAGAVWWGVRGHHRLRFL